MRSYAPRNTLNLKRISIALRPEEFETLDIASEQLDINRSEMLRRILQGEATVASLLEGVVLSDTWLPRGFLIPSEDIPLLKIFATENNVSLSRLVRDILHETV